jgi:phosphomannomutase
LEGLSDENIAIIDAGLTTTPMHYFIINKTNADGGAMITASHNPSEFNGIKLCKKNAVPIGEGAGMEEIKGDAMRGIFAVSQTDDARASNLICKEEFLNEYIAFFEGKFLELKDYNVKLTACLGNGMTSIFIPKLFKKFPNVKIKFLHSEMDMTFPNHEANPLKTENLKDIQGSVLNKKADLGISFDGDGDRVGFVDEKGNIVRGDIITALLVRYFMNAEAVIYDLRSSRVVREEIEKYGMRSIESRVGHAFIKALMRKEDAVFGGEVSGHYYFRNFFFCDSAVFATLAVLDLMRIEKKSLSALVEPLLKYAKSEELNYAIKDKEKMLDKIVAYFQEAKISYLDGIKIEYWDAPVPLEKRWWFSLRPSNTEDLIRLNIEASTKELLFEKKKLLDELLK